MTNRPAKGTIERNERFEREVQRLGDGGEHDRLRFALSKYDEPREVELGISSYGQTHILASFRAFFWKGQELTEDSRVLGVQACVSHLFGSIRLRMLAL